MSSLLPKVLTHEAMVPRQPISSMVLAVGLVCAGALVVSRSHVPSEVIASSATRTPEPIERAWHLPVAPTFQRHVDWQSNGSRCGPAPVANTYLSLGEAATRLST